MRGNMRTKEDLMRDKIIGEKTIAGLMPSTNIGGFEAIDLTLRFRNCMIVFPTDHPTHC